MNILFVHEVSYQKKVIYEIHEFPELLALRGHDVSFLEFNEGHRFWKNKEIESTEKINGRIYPTAILNIHRPFQFGLPGIDRLLATLTVLPKLNSLLRSQVFDCIVLYAVPTYGLQTLWLAKKKRVPVVFRAIDASHKIRRSLFSPIIRWVERRIYRNVDLISANNPAMACYCKLLGSRTKRTAVNYPPLDLNHFESIPRDNSLRDTLGISMRDKVLVYMGSFFYFSGLKEAVLEFRRQSMAAPKLKLLLIGGGEQDQELRRLVQDLELEKKVIFTGFVDYMTLPKYLKIADVALNTLDNTLVANLALPNKVLQYLAAGLPVLSTKLDGLYSVLKSNPSIIWEDCAKSVVMEAAKLSSSKLQLIRPGKASHAELDKFLPNQSVQSFEAELIKLVKEFGC